MDKQAGRDHRDATVGSAHLEFACQLGTIDAPSKAFGLDLTVYLNEIEEFPLSEEQKLNFLFVVTAMMEFCVRHGVDVGICGQLLEAFTEASTPNPAGLQLLPQQHEGGIGPSEGGQSE
ncbi:hypothetical protein GCM10011321_28400 [Youhaiella tibetensis]|uniref:hypothetical protein n=1 Tax=Paradevosia tibetensis TaxID=1447062 RepID=UPI0019CC7D30|nr:hypothetical protein [Youhaiella tibetensis]GGF35669.1 hypothetical protein GCM10011321_28400 [Youhaiella tibetensis]